MCSFFNTVSCCSAKPSKMNLMVSIWAVCGVVKLKYLIAVRCCFDSRILMARHLRRAESIPLRCHSSATWAVHYQYWDCR